MKTAGLLLIFVFVASSARAANADWAMIFAHNISVHITLTSDSTKYPQQLPRPLSQPLPEYPVKMREEGVTGESAVRFIVTRDGVTTNATVVKASQPEFGEAALEAAKRWRFSPALDRDRKTPISIELEYRFVFERHQE